MKITVETTLSKKERKFIETLMEEGTLGVIVKIEDYGFSLELPHGLRGTHLRNTIQNMIVDWTMDKKVTRFVFVR